MSTKQDEYAGIFENRRENLQHFTGIKVPSSKLAELDCAGKDIAIIGTDQFTVSQLNKISQQARSVKVFQINPQIVLPGTERGLQRLLNHPLIIKNRRLFNNRIKVFCHYVIWKIRYRIYGSDASSCQTCSCIQSLS